MEISILYNYLKNEMNANIVRSKIFGGHERVVQVRSAHSQERREFLIQRDRVIFFRGV